MTRNILALAAFLSLPALAAEPAPPKAVKDLQNLVGSWKGTGTLKMPDGQVSPPVQIGIECKSTAGGMGVLCHSRFTGIPGMPGALEEDDLFGYNAGDGLVHWYAVTNAGETHDHKGGISDNAFVGIYEGPQDGQLFQEQVTLAWKSDRKITFRSASTLAGKDQGVMEGTVSK